MRVTLNTVVLLGCSMVVGALLALLSVHYGSPSHQYSKWRKRMETPLSEHYKAWLERNNLSQRYGGILSTQLVQESDYLRATVKTLCWVLLNGDGSKTQAWPFLPNMKPAATAISETWGRRCAKTLYFSSSSEAQSYFSGALDVVVLQNSDLHSWAASREIVLHLAGGGYLEKYDWFYQAEEDTFTVVENMLYYLSVLNATEPLYIGHAYSRWGTSYNTAGPGFVMSRAALRRLHTHLVKGHCGAGLIGHGDIGLGRCLEEVGVGVVDSRDTQGRAHFLAHQPETLLVAGNLPWSVSFWAHSKYLSPEGPDCCSDHAISFHDVPSNMMYVLDYLVYHLKPFGITPSLLRPAPGQEGHPPPGGAASHPGGGPEDNLNHPSAAGDHGLSKRTEGLPTQLQPPNNRPSNL